MDNMKAPVSYTTFPFTENLFVKRCGCAPYDFSPTGFPKPWHAERIATKWNKENPNHQVIYNESSKQYRFKKEE